MSRRCIIVKYIKAERRLRKQKAFFFLMARKAESGSNVHLFWQTETTGRTRSGKEPSAEITVKCEVEESSGMHAHSLRLCVRTLSPVLKA